jgi:hypothetical protein
MKGYETTAWIASIQLLNELPERYEKPEKSYVDKFGQWNIRNWKGKVKNEKQLARNLQKHEKTAEKAEYPENWSQYGGWKEKQFEATGFFRTHHDSTRWWLVDPEGYAFISIGLDCIHSKAAGVFTNCEELLEWLPDEKDKLYREAFRPARSDQKSFDYMTANLMRVYKYNWKDKFNKITKGMLVDWRFNTIGNWSDPAFIAFAKMPYVLPMKDFPSTDVLLYRDFPDVYDPAYRKAAAKFAKQLDVLKEDPYMIGYFLRNEPHWAFGEHNLAFEMLKTTQESYTKKAFIDWIKEKYKYKIEQFNNVWKLELIKFDDVTELALKDMPSQMAKVDMKEFSLIMVDKYVQVVSDEVEKVDPNHLNLGMRYAWISSDLCYRAGQHFDVFSINGYNNPGPPETAEITKRTGKPVMIGEWHFGAVDRGLPATGIQGAKDQDARGTAYRYYIEQGFARPELIGVHYFKLNDQNIIGRFDGENYQIGFWDICYEPYKEIVKAAIESHEKIYKVAIGSEAPFDKVIDEVPAIY